MLDNVLRGIFYDQISLAGLVFDAYLTMRESHELEITQHPVEDGSTVSDHAYKKPIIFEYEIGVSNASQGKVLGQFGLLDRSKQAFELLFYLQKSRIPVPLVNKYGTYSNVLIQSFVPTDDYRTADTLRARIVLREVQITYTQQNLANSNPAILDKNNRGTQSASEADNNWVTAARSIEKTLGVP